MNLRFLDEYSNFGLLLLRIGFGVMFVLHGQGKVFGGSATWVGVGRMVLGGAGPNFVPAILGLLAGLAEFVGGMLLIVGLFSRLAAIIMLLTMLGAMKFHISAGHGFARLSHPIEAAIVFLALFALGPGRYSLHGMFLRRGTQTQ